MLHHWGILSLSITGCGIVCWGTRAWYCLRLRRARAQGAAMYSRTDGRRSDGLDYEPFNRLNGGKATIWRDR